MGTRTTQIQGEMKQISVTEEPEVVGGESPAWVATAEPQVVAEDPNNGPSSPSLSLPPLSLHIYHHSCGDINGDTD
jgi:hypothetical protein